MTMQSLQTTWLTFFFFYICFIFYSCWVFVAVCRLSLVAESGSTLRTPCTGFSLLWFLLLWSTGSRALGLQYLLHMGSVVVAQGLSWDLLRPETETVSTALQGGFLTTRPPGKFFMTEKADYGDSGKKKKSQQLPRSGHRGYLGQWNYSVRYCKGGYMTLYVCQTHRMCNTKRINVNYGP